MKNLEDLKYCWTPTKLIIKKTDFYQQKAHKKWLFLHIFFSDFIHTIQNVSQQKRLEEMKHKIGNSVQSYIDYNTSF